MNDHKVVIIVPVYNVEAYLPQCLDSIISQTFKDWACILVDDGSKDNSGAICDEYTKKDSRFSVIHKENGGVSSARNTGIKQAKGEWVYFSDADDTLEKDALETLLKGTGNDCQIVMAGFNKYSENKALKETNTSDIVKEITVEEAIIEQYKPTDFSYQGYLWCKLFKLDVIKERNLRFDEGITFNEDGLFIMQYICCLKSRIYYTTKPVYNYIERSSSAMGSMQGHFNPKFVTHFDAVIKLKEVVFNYTNDKRIKNEALKRIVFLYYYIHLLMRQTKEYNPSIHKILLRGLLKSGAFGEYLNEYFFRPIKTIILQNIALLWPGLLVKIKKY